MLPDRPGHADPDRLPELLRGFTTLAAATEPGAVAEGVIRFMLDMAARDVRLVLEPRPGEVLSLRGTPEGIEPVDSRTAPPFLEDLRRRCADPGVATATAAEDGLCWTCLAIPGSRGPLGTLAFGMESESVDCIVGFAILASTLGTKTDQLVLRSDGEWEKQRNADWFRTMDEQIRVLEGERQKFAALVNKTDAAILVTDPQGKIVWVNPVMSRRYAGPGPLRLAEGSCRILCGVEEGSCADCPVRQVREGAPIVHQERQEHRDGDLRHLYLSAFPVRAPEGHVNEILIMIQDITDLETLRKSEARYQLLFERSADAILMADPETFAIVMANREARRLLGYGPEEVVSRTLLEVHPEPIRAAMESQYHHLETGRTLENLEVEVLAAGEEIRTCNACGTMFDLDGQNLILVEFRDVTRLRELQAELARSDHLITLGTMNAGIAHEFKNRLAPLRAFAQLISLDGMSPDRVMGHAPLIIEEIDRLTGLVRDILEYARPQEPRPEGWDLTTLARTLCQESAWEFNGEIEAKQIDLEIALDPEDPCPVIVDPVQLRRIFVNLFKNSLEALVEKPEGPRKLTVGVGREPEGIVLSIEDTGCGIRDDHLTRIFDPFFTTKGSRGTGLGMCITRSLIEANGGEIEVGSEIGRGTRITIRFPAADRRVTGGRDAA